MLLFGGLATLIVIFALALMTPALQERAVVASASTGRAVRFDGGLSLHPQKDGLVFAGLHLGQPAWALRFLETRAVTPSSW
jgi:hypothetical protein